MLRPEEGGAVIQLKRVYEAASKNDGYRVLIDRLWPRGIKKENLPLDAWMKELAPSTELRKQFNHDPKRWHDFQTRYTKELRSVAAKEKIRFLVDIANKTNVTLLYSARDQEHNGAVVLKKVIDRELTHCLAD